MRALLVDDREENLKLLELTLGSAASEIERARDGEEALRKLRARRYDVVISDIMMPVMDGFQLCRHIRADEQLRDVIFVFVTATYTDPKDEALAKRLGADGFYAKPIDPDVFVEEIRELVFSRKGASRNGAPSPLEDATYWKEYASRVVSKLEDKLTELEIAHHKQRLLNETLEARVEERTAALAGKSNELAASNRELSAFAYSIAHDFRSPLRSISMLVGVAREEGLKDHPRAEDALTRIQRAAWKMNDLLDALLSYTSVTTADIALEPVELNAVVATAVELLSADIQKANATVVVENQLPRVMAQRSILEQVLLNLISNGIKFVETGVRPEVRIGLARSEWSPSDRVVRFWVEDNGIGIPPEFHQRVFGLFERLHTAQAYPGSGLGLSIVRRGVERMGGRVGLISNVARGTCFWVELARAM